MSSPNRRIGSTKLTRYFLNCFRVFGLWLDAKHSTPCNQLHTLGTCVFYGIYLTCLMTYLFFTIDLEDTVNAMYMSLTILSLFVKIVNFVAKNASIRRCLDQVHDFELLDDAEKLLYQRRHTNFSRLMVYYYTVCYITAAAGGVNAAFQATLPFRGSYPCDWRRGATCYWSVYAYQMFGIGLCVHLNVTLEQFTCFLMYEISVQLEILGGRLMQIGGTGGREKAQHAADLRQWVKMHNRSLSLIKDVQGSFSLANFSQISTSGVVMCALLLQLALISPREYIAYATYVLFNLSMFSEIFLPCYFGNELMLRSDALQYQGFSANWTDMRATDKKTLCIVLERLRQTSQVMVAKMFPLNLSTFSSILNFSYRLFTLLQNFVK